MQYTCPASAHAAHESGLTQEIGCSAPLPLTARQGRSNTQSILLQLQPMPFEVYICRWQAERTDSTVRHLEQKSA